MKKKNKRKTRFVFRNNNFDTLKVMKTFAYFNSKVGEKDTGFEVYNDEIISIYDFNKQERRLLCRKIYNKEENDKKESEKKQLKLFDDG